MDTKEEDENELMTIKDREGHFLLFCAMKAVFDRAWDVLRDQSPEMTHYSLRYLKEHLAQDVLLSYRLLQQEDAADENLEEDMVVEAEQETELEEEVTQLREERKESDQWKRRV